MNQSDRHWAILTMLEVSQASLGDNSETSTKDANLTIAELAVLIMEISNQEIHSTFQAKIKPMKEITTPQYYSQTTGTVLDALPMTLKLTKETQATNLALTIRKMDQWMKTFRFTMDNTIAVVWGNRTLMKTLPRACKDAGTEIPAVFDVKKNKKFINMKKIVSRAGGKIPTSIPEMLRSIQIPYLRRHFNNLDEAANIATSLRYGIRSEWDLSPTNNYIINEEAQTARNTFRPEPSIDEQYQTSAYHITYHMPGHRAGTAMYFYKRFSGLFVPIEDLPPYEEEEPQ